MGEALVALKHDELKEMGIASVGHRLTILKQVYELKIEQDVTVEPDDYVPLCELAPLDSLAPTDSAQRRRQILDSRWPLKKISLE